jgi:pimeloyl-ACP methyl ester carboxylesterase
VAQRHVFPEVNTQTITVDGVSMRWVEQGAGVPVILVHGIPTSPALWREVMPRIKGARCLAFEMVGYGSSIPEGRGRDISVARQADYLLAWARAIGLPSAVLAGHDLGGGVVQIAALRHPDFCRGLFLTNAIGYDSWPIPSVKLLRSTGPLVRLLPQRMARQIVRTLMIRGHVEHSRADEATRIHWSCYARHEGAAALVRQMKALDVQDTLAVAGELPRLKAPARIVWGAADPFQKIRYGERFARDLSAPLRRLPEGRHFTPEDYPELIAEEIEALVRQCAPAA